MMMKLKKAAVVVLAVAALSGCAEVGWHTYPPSMVRLEPTQITGAMTRYSLSLWRLDDIIASAETVLPYQREEIIRLLREMETQADRLGAGATVTNHLVIDKHIDEFKTELVRARREVEKEPPNYYRAGRLYGGCQACHVMRTG
jgi:hypothetical protein